ncbi:MAG: histone deacetylase family protein [Burkholderiaceae bacterium]
MKLAYITHPSSLQHEMGPHHPECPERLSSISDRLLLRGVLDWADSFEAPAATYEQIARAHDARHYLELQAAAPSDGYRQVDPDTAMNPFTWTAALHAAGAAVLATELVAGGRYPRAFCCVRPPGHHATRGAAMGFCFFNNIAIGVLHALEHLGLQRVALIDFDVHHGNGSEDILAGDERVLMVSTFQSRLYPFSGERPLAPNMRNVPLPAYSDGEPMRRAVVEQWLPALTEFAPQMLFVSAGFDAHRDDELSHLMWRDDDYAWVSRELVAFADRHCEGRLVSTLEGGYHLPALARCVELHLRALAGID